MILTEKKRFINNVQATLLQSERVSEMLFPAIWRPEFQKILFLCPPWGYLMETVNSANYKKTESMGGGGGGGGTAVDKRAKIKD